jgi:hypothetical protein
VLVKKNRFDTEGEGILNFKDFKNFRCQNCSLKSLKFEIFEILVAKVKRFVESRFLFLDFT